MPRKQAPPKKKSEAVPQRAGRVVAREAVHRGIKQEMKIREAAQKTGIDRGSMVSALKRAEIAKRRQHKAIKGMEKDVNRLEREQSKEMGQKKHPDNPRAARKEAREVRKRGREVDKEDRLWQKENEAQQVRERAAQQDRRMGQQRKNAEAARRQEQTSGYQKRLREAEEAKRRRPQRPVPKVGEQPKTAQQYAAEAARRKAGQKTKEFVAKKAVAKVGLAATAKKLGGPATAMYEVGTYGSQSPKQVDKQVEAFEKRNPGWTIVKTKNGYRTVKK